MNGGHCQWNSTTSHSEILARVGITINYIVIMYSRFECCYYLPFIKLFQLRDQDDEYNKEANAAAQAVFCCEFPESVLLPRRAHRVLHSGQ